MRPIAIASLLFLLTFATTGHGQPKPPPAAETPATPPAPSMAHRSALETVVRGIAAGVGRPPKRARVYVGALQSDAAAPQSEGLLAKVAELVAGRLGPDVQHEPTPMTRDEARRKSTDVDGFLFLDVKISRGLLLVSGDAFRVPRTIWARARSVKPGPVSHAQAHAPIDAEVRSYLAPLQFEAKPHVAKYTGSDPDVLAVACGDMDGDGGNELITVTRQRVLTVRLAEGKVERVTEASWKDLAPIAAVPLREPFALTSMVPSADRLGSYLDVGLTDRRGGVRLDHGLNKVGQHERMPVPHGGATACARISRLLLQPERATCGEGEPSPFLSKVAEPTDALASAFLVSPDGSGRGVVALRRKGMLVLHGLGTKKIIGRVGAQMAVGDIDQDGAPEVMTSVDTLAAKFDAVEVRSILPRGTVKRRLRLAAPSGVRALAVCPPDGPGAAPMVVATGTEIWVVR